MLAWERRVELAQQYAPHLVLFDEDKAWASPRLKAGPATIIHAVWICCWNAAACIRARCVL